MLVGGLSPEGTRQDGALDVYFSKAEISSILKQAAEILAKDIRDRQKASMAGTFFMLAGDYKSVFQLLSRQLSTDASVHSEDKLYWYQQTRTFFSTYILNGPSHVVDCLERNDEVDVIGTCKALMELHDFFECANKGAFNDAWNILVNLEIIPRTQADVSSKEVRYQSLDPLLQNLIPSVLLAAMQSLHHEHSRVKKSGVRDTTQNVLKQLKERARVIVTFAGLISCVDKEKIEFMSRLEASMI